MENQVAELKGHYILCGVGRTGLNIAEDFVKRRMSLVVVEQNPEAISTLKGKLQHAMGKTLYLIEADATEDQALEDAGIRQARGLIAAMGEDKDNLFVVLTARSLNSRIRIVTRVQDERSNTSKLEKAGADKVISTNVIGGLRAASEMIRPSVVTFLDDMVHMSDKAKTLRFTELPVSEINAPELVQIIEANREDGENTPKLTIKDIGRYTGLLVVAVKAPNHSSKQVEDSLKRQRKYRFTPRGDVELDSEDILVVIGTQDKLEEVRGEE